MDTQAKPYSPPQFLNHFRHAIDQLERMDTSWVFARPVDQKKYPNYADYVQQPMDYSTMRKKIEGHLYTTAADFQKDFDLVIDNCLAYHPEVAMAYQAALKTKDEAAGILKQIWDEIDLALRENNREESVLNPSNPGPTSDRQKSAVNSEETAPESSDVPVPENVGTPRLVSPKITTNFPQVTIACDTLPLNSSVQETSMQSLSIPLQDMPAINATRQTQNSPLNLSMKVRKVFPTQIERQKLPYEEQIVILKEMIEATKRKRRGGGTLMRIKLLSKEMCNISSLIEKHSNKVPVRVKVSVPVVVQRSILKPAYQKRKVGRPPGKYHRTNRPRNFFGMHKRELKESRTKYLGSSDDDTASGISLPKRKSQFSREPYEMRKKSSMVLASSAKYQFERTGGTRILRSSKHAEGIKLEEVATSSVSTDATSARMKTCVVRLEPLSAYALSTSGLHNTSGENRSCKYRTCSTVETQTCHELLSPSCVGNVAGAVNHGRSLDDSAVLQLSSVHPLSVDKIEKEAEKYMIPDVPDINDVLKDVAVVPKKEGRMIFWPLLGSSRKMQHMYQEKTFVRQIRKKEMLISAIKSRPELWDKRNPGYGDAMLCMAQWQHVASSLDLSVKSVRKQWRHLIETFKNNYQSFSKKLPSDKRSDDVISKVAWTQWNLFIMMMFLHPTMAKEHRKLHKVEENGKSKKDDSFIGDVSLPASNDDDICITYMHPKLNKKRPSSISSESVQSMPKLFKEHQPLLLEVDEVEATPLTATAADNKDVYFDVFGKRISELASQVPAQLRSKCMKLVTDVMHSFISNDDQSSGNDELSK